MTRKIALEEHFLVEGFANMGRAEGSGPAAAVRRQAAERLPEIDALRLDAMDKVGIDLAVLSLFQPGIQGERDTATAIRKAKAVNDTLARADRQASRALPRFRRGADAGSARSRRRARARGETARVQGRANQRPHPGRLSRPRRRCLPFWERVAALDVPIYLHPANPMTIPAVFEGYPGLAQAIFGWAAESRRSCAAAGALRALRPLPVAHDHPRAYGRGAPLSPLAHRQPLRRSASPRYRCARCRPHTSARTSPSPPPASVSARAAALRDRRNGPRPRAVLGPLPARG